MSLIQQQKAQIEALSLRVQQLESEKKEIQNDIVFVATKVAETWQYMNLDLSGIKMSEKPNIIEMTRATMPILQKFVSGKIKIAEIITRFEAFKPVLEKYKPLVANLNTQSNV